MATKSYFTVDELCASDTAKKYGIDNTPNPTIITRLQRLINFLNPIREAWGSAIKVTSGYRCEKLNCLVGGSKTSSHTIGYGVDLIPLNGKRYQAFIGDPSQFYHRVKAGGYATDPDYVAKLTNMYNSSIFSAKQGGNIPSRIDALVEKFNKQFNK